MPDAFDAAPPVPHPYSLPDARFLTAVNDPNLPYSPIEAWREIERSLVEVGRSAACVPGTVRLHPADMIKLRAAIPAKDYLVPPDAASLLSCAVIVDFDVPAGDPQWSDCRVHSEHEACRLRHDAAVREVEA